MSILLNAPLPLPALLGWRMQGYPPVELYTGLVYDRGLSTKQP